MFILVLLGQFWRLIWGIGLAISPPRFIKLTHSRMRVGYLEWPGWVGGLVYLCARCVCGRSCLFVCQGGGGGGGVLFICVWRASACSSSRELCCLDGETGHRACTKNPFWYCHWYIQELRPNAEKLFPLKSCRLLLRLKCIISHVVGVFHVVYWRGGVLFICVWRASACSPSRELCCLDGETGHRACTKNPFWYCHWYIQELRPNAEKPFPLKSCRLLLRLKCIISHVVGVFHVVYCDDKKKKKMQFWICHERRLHRYTNQITFLLLSLTDFIQLAINIITSYMAKNIRRHNGCTSYIYC